MLSRYYDLLSKFRVGLSGSDLKTRVWAWCCVCCRAHWGWTVGCSLLWYSVACTVESLTLFHLLFISWLYVPGDESFMSYGSYMQTKHLCVLIDIRIKGSPASLHWGPWARHIYPSLVLVQSRKTRPCLTERLLMGRKESNQTNKRKN